MYLFKPLFLTFMVCLSLSAYSQITVRSVTTSNNLTSAGGGPAGCGAGQFKLNQGPDISSGCIRMTPPNTSDNTGVAWVCDPINLDSSFHMTTSVTFGSNTSNGDGIVFAIKKNSSPNLYGGVGGNIGYHNPGPAGAFIGMSLGIEFDSFVDGAGTFDTGLSCGHAQIVRDGDLTKKVGGATCLMAGGANINDGKAHTIDVYWDSTKDKEKFWAFLDNRMVACINQDIRTFFDTKTVYWGFTAGDGGGTNQNNHIICNTVMSIGSSFIPAAGTIKNPACTFLPVTLLSFKAEKANDEVLIKWTTASESNSDYFMLRKSNNAVDYGDVCKITAAGNSNSNIDYSCLDKANETTYYLLEQYDYDGTKTSYGPIVFNVNNNQIKITKYYSILGIYKGDDYSKLEPGLYICVEDNSFHKKIFKY
jgi:hypothetical protein